MYTEMLKVSDYNTRDYQMYINASWITIRNQNGAIVYKRGADNGSWYDESHVAIVNAIYALEKAVFNAVESEKDKYSTQL